MSLFSELKRRNVFRAAATYLALGWVVTQVTATVAPALHLPEWIVPVVVWIGVIGFPFVIVFSWVFELTPEGLKRETEIERDATTRQVTARRLDYLAIGLLALGIVLIGADRLIGRGGAPTAPETQPRTEAAAAPAQAAPAVSERSIAVLPFADLSPSHDQEYFSDGVAEEILDALAQVPGLKVAGRTSSFYFKGKSETVQAIGAALGVAHVLEGSVRKQGDKVRITAQLLQTRDGFHLWSESYDGELSNVFELQERIARAIAAKLQVVLDGGAKAQLAQKATDNPDAHQQYLRGRYFLMRRGFANLRNAEGAFKAALVADPGYADAWAGLAQVYALLPEYSTFDPDAHAFADTVPQALEAASRALALDPNSARALSARAYVKTGTLFDWEGAEADYKAAIASDPRDATARQWYGEMLTYQRRFDEALRSFDAAVAAEPLAPIVHFSRGLCVWQRGDLDAAIKGMEEGHRLAPELYNLNFNLMLMFVEARRYADARALMPMMPAGEQAMWSAFLDATESGKDVDRAVREVSARHIAGITGTPVMLMMLGRREEALAMLERLFAARDPLREFIASHGVFEPLRSDPRFQALVKQIRLPATGSKAAAGS